MEHWRNLSLNNISEEHEGIIYKEEWKVISEFPFYMVSNFGRIKSLPKLKIRNKRAGNYITKEKILKQCQDIKHTKYVRVSLCNEEGIFTKLVHILVGEHFIENPDNKPEVNHKKGIKTDNRVHQLEWNTRSENQKHSYRIGLKDKKGEKHHLCKLKEEDVVDIRYLYNKKILTGKQIANKYNISSPNVCDIVKRRSWKHI